MDADVEGGVAEPDGSSVAVGVFRRAVEGFEEDAAGRTTKRADECDQVVDQLVGELANEVPLPVVPVVAVGGVDEALLVEEAVRAQLVVDEAGG